MRWRIWQTGIAPRLTCWLCLAFGLWVLAAGCWKSHPRSVEHVEVSGKVLFQDKPLPGGQITFLTPIGGFANTGPIDENGNYQIRAPVGPVQIGVDNRALEPRTQELDKRMAKMIRGRPVGPGPLELKGLKGRYVAIPPKYYRVDTSGLTYEVKPEAQTYDIVLDNK